MDIDSPQQTYTVSQVAEAIGVSVSSVRSWCTEFKDSLTPGAAPANGVMRQFTNQDIATLQQVRRLRSQGLTYDQVRSRLATEPGDHPDHPALFVAGPTALPMPTDGPTDVTAMQVAIHLLQAVDERTGPLQRRLDALQSQQSTRITWLVIGFCCGLLAALAAAGLLALVR